MKTFKGRVVYNRKRHVFSYSDLARIARAFTPATLVLRLRQEDWGAVGAMLLQTAQRIIGKVPTSGESFEIKSKGVYGSGDTYYVDITAAEIDQADVLLIYRTEND
jgi:hypothetical protein